MNDLTIAEPIAAEGKPVGRSSVRVPPSTTSVRSASAAAQGFGGLVAFSSLDKSNIPDILTKV